MKKHRNLFLIKEEEIATSIDWIFECQRVIRVDFWSQNNQLRTFLLSKLLDAIVSLLCLGHAEFVKNRHSLSFYFWWFCRQTVFLEFMGQYSSFLVSYLVTLFSIIFLHFSVICFILLILFCFDFWLSKMHYFQFCWKCK